MLGKKLLKMKKTGSKTKYYFTRRINMIRNKKLIKSSTLEDAFTVYPWSKNCWKHSDKDLGLSYAVEAYGEEFLNLDDSTLNDLRDTLITYFNDKAYVRDWNINYPDDQIEEFSDIMTEEDLSNEELARYFDYERFGRDIRLENNMIWDNKRECWFSGNDTDDYDVDDVTFLGSSKGEKGKKVVKSSRKAIKSAESFTMNGSKLKVGDEVYVKDEDSFGTIVNLRGNFVDVKFDDGTTNDYFADNCELTSSRKAIKSADRKVRKTKEEILDDIEWYKNQIEDTKNLLNTIHSKSYERRLDDLQESLERLNEILENEEYVDAPQNITSSRKPIESGYATKTYKEWWNSIDDYLAHMLMKEGYNHNNVYNIGISELRASGEEDKLMSMDEFVDFICHKTGIPYSNRNKIKRNLMKLQSSRKAIKSAKDMTIEEFCDDMELTREHGSLLMDEMDTDDWNEEKFSVRELVKAMNKLKDEQTDYWYSLFDDEITSSRKPIKSSKKFVKSSFDDETDDETIDIEVLADELVKEGYDPDIVEEIKDMWLNEYSISELTDDEDRDFRHDVERRSLNSSRKSIKSSEVKIFSANSNSIAKAIEKETGLNRSKKNSRYGQALNKNGIAYAQEFRGYSFDGDFHVENEYGEVYKIKFDRGIPDEKKQEIIDVLNGLGGNATMSNGYIRFELSEDENKWYGSEGRYRKGKFRLNKSYKNGYWKLYGDNGYEQEFYAGGPSSAKYNADLLIKEYTEGNNANQSESIESSAGKKTNLPKNLVRQVLSNKITEDQAINRVMISQKCNRGVARVIFNRWMDQNRDSIIKSDAAIAEIQNEFNPDGNLDSWAEIYMPGSGKANTKGGELVRAAQRILAAYYASEAMIGRGLGNELVNPAARYIVENTEFELNSDIQEMLDHDIHYDDSEYDSWLKSFETKFEDYLRNNSELFSEANDDDMDDYRKDEDSEFFLNKCYVEDDNGNEYFVENKDGEWKCTDIVASSENAYSVGDEISEGDVLFEKVDKSEEYGSFEENGTTYFYEASGNPGENGEFDTFKITEVQLTDQLFEKDSFVDYEKLEELCEDGKLFDVNGNQIHIEDFQRI